MTSLICKISYGGETRRFSVQVGTVSGPFESIRARAEALFSLGRTNFKLQYKDDEEDVITMSTEEEMLEAISVALTSVPPILRLSVKVDEPVTEGRASETEAETPSFDTPFSLAALPRT